MEILDFLKKVKSCKFLDTGGKNYKDIIESIFIPMACFCMVIAVTLFLGRLFHKIQPWFSIIQGFLTLLFGLYCFWYAHKIFKILTTSHRKAWDNYDFRFSIKASIVSSMIALAAFFVAALRQQCPYWISVVLFAIGFGLYCLGLCWLGFFKALWDLRESDKEVYKENSQSKKADFFGEVAGLGVVGLLYIAIFLPLTLWSAAVHGLDPIDVLLFARLLDDWAELDILGKLNTLLNNPSHLFAFGALYGAVSITIGLMIVFLRKEGWLEILIMSNGLLYGYVLTIWIKHLLGTPLTSKLLFSSIFGFVYVFILYYVLRSLLDVISGWGIRAKYEHLIGGIQGIGTGWILSRVFGDQSTVFSGMTFFICTFITTCIIEVTIGRLFERVYKFLPDQTIQSIVPVVLAMAREPHPGFQAALFRTVIIGGIFPLLVFGIVKLLILAL